MDDIYIYMTTKKEIFSSIALKIKQEKNETFDKEIRRQK